MLALVVILGLAAGVFVITRPTLTPAQIAARAERARLAALAAKERSDVIKAERLVNVALPSQQSAPAPAIPNRLFVHPLHRRLVVGFAPYWTISSLVGQGSSSPDITDTSELIYSSVCVGADATIVTTAGDCANGFNDLSSPTFTSFMQIAHADGDRVLLSVQTIDPSIIHTLSSHASTLAVTLATNLLNLVHAHGFDGVNLDIEGRGAIDRAGYVNFVRDFSVALKRSSPTLELVADTYPQSAATSTDFYDVAHLARYVNDLFVMAYQMENGTHSSANSPLATSNLGWSAVQTLVQYQSVVPSDKLILGLPFYGLNFETKTARPGSPLVSNYPSARLYSDILAANRAPRWDVVSKTPYTVFKENGAWHQDWYDNPVSLALKSALAQVFHIAGVGVWAMTMEGSDSRMLTALTGGSAPLKLGAVTLSARG